MRVKVGELKTHFSAYLRKIEESGEALEVCVRERPVAYLLPAKPSREHVQGLPNPELNFATRLNSNGLKVLGVAVAAGKDALPPPRLAGDNRDNVESVREMREGKEW
jgi:antitoxin (DNA-binding transcriptional repressor) of toxin-antitoxin stability system